VEVRREFARKVSRLVIKMQACALDATKLSIEACCLRRADASTRNPATVLPKAAYLAAKHVISHPYVERLCSYSHRRSRPTAANEQPSMLQCSPLRASTLSWPIRMPRFASWSTMSAGEGMIHTCPCSFTASRMVLTVPAATAALMRARWAPPQPHMLTVVAVLHRMQSGQHQLQQAALQRFMSSPTSCCLICCISSRTTQTSLTSRCVGNLPKWTIAGSDRSAPCLQAKP